MNAKRPDILVIEDNPMNMELICDLLEVHGFAIYKSTTAEEGIRLANEHRPGVILMDIQLPGMDGLEATRILKSNPDTASIRIIALTSHAMAGYEENVKAAGCDGYIAKPINTRTIVDEIMSHVG